MRDLIIQYSTEGGGVAQAGGAASIAFHAASTSKFSPVLLAYWHISCAVLLCEMGASYYVFDLVLVLDKLG